jgi:hypothetical protein
MLIDSQEGEVDSACSFRDVEGVEAGGEGETVSFGAVQRDRLAQSLRGGTHVECTDAT